MPNTIALELELFHRQHQELRGVFLIQDGSSSHIAGGTRVFRRKQGLVEAPIYARQCVVVEPGGNPHPCVQALLSETGVLEEQGGVQDPCIGFLARVQPMPCPPL